MVFRNHKPKRIPPSREQVLQNRIETHMSNLANKISKAAEEFHNNTDDELYDYYYRPVMTAWCEYCTAERALWDATKNHPLHDAMYGITRGVEHSYVHYMRGKQVEPS